MSESLAKTVVIGHELPLMEDNAHGMPAARPHLADAVPQIHPIKTARALHGPIVNRKYHAVSLAQRRNNRP